MKLRTMIVEDEIPQAEAARHILQSIGATQMKQAGIDGFEIALAHYAAEAFDLLRQAEQTGKPYDLLLLDLGLPRHKGEAARPEQGVDILKFALDTETARGVIVISVFTELERFIRLGATDFIGKPYSKEDLQSRALIAWGKVKEKYRQRMLEDLAPYANNGVSYRLSSCFSRFIQSMRHETEEIRRELVKDLDRNPMDGLSKSLAQHLAAVEEAIKNAREEWKQIQKPFKLADELPRGVVVEQVLERLAEELRPCLTLCLETPTAQPTRILSFQDEFQDNAVMVIREILVGGLSETKEGDLSKFWEVRVKVTTQDGMAEIQFRDNFIPIPEPLAKQINNGDNIAPREGQWRAWGLSVVQHIALRGGGRLIVKPLEDGNLITYRVTLAQDV